MHTHAMHTHIQLLPQVPLIQCLQNALQPRNPTVRDSPFFLLTFYCAFSCHFWSPPISFLLLFYCFFYSQTDGNYQTTLIWYLFSFHIFTWKFNHSSVVKWSTIFIYTHFLLYQFVTWNNNLYQDQRMKLALFLRIVSDILSDYLVYIISTSGC